MARHPNTFNRLYVAMVEAGEAAGVLDVVLDRVAMQIEKEQKIKRRVSGAMIYPTVVLTFASLVLTRHADVPGAGVRQDLRHAGRRAADADAVGDGLQRPRAYWFIIFPMIGRILFGFFKWKKTETGRQAWDRFKLRIPMSIGTVVRKVAMARLSRTLSTLIASGVDIMKALEITAQTSGNWVVETATNTCASGCRRARRLRSR